MKKISIGKLLLIAVCVTVTVAAFVLSPYIYGEESVFNRSVSNNVTLQTAYQKTPALIKSVQIITIAALLSAAVRWLLGRMFKKSNRGITVAKLAGSFIRWIILIAGALMVLGAWGVNTSTLIASAGILSLVIGLGAQSLVADIIAGLFIVLEGEYQVGDIVVIDDWRGTVQEIGIRTTKIVDAGGNVKIINNSSISSIVNQTQELSVAKSYISIEYGESIPHVERIISENLEGIRQRIPSIVDGPFYKGVNELAASSVDLLFVAKCREEDVYQVQRDMNRELKLLFDQNKINIPFPQIVLNQPTVFEDNPETPSDTRSFVDDQRLRSKGIEEKSN